MELSRRLTKVADECADMHQYAMRKYADAFHIIPTTLAEVSGHNAVNVITSLMADPTRKVFATHITSPRPLVEFT